MIISVEYLAENVVNEELYELCLEQPEKVERYLNLVENKIKIYLDIEQFKKGEEYLFPDDLKEVVRFLVESLYLNRSLNTSQGKLKSYSEKHDDYSESMDFDSSGTKMRYGIPILADYLQVLNKYRGESIIGPSGRFSI